MSERTKNLIVLLLASAASLLLAEALTRRFVKLGGTEHISENGLRWNSDHPTRDYQLTPGYRGRFTHPDFDTSIGINSLGFRGAEPESVDQRPIFAIGDSFTFGWGVEGEESFPSRLGDLLGEKGLESSVWNLGVPGYAFQQYVLMLEDYLELATPRAVVLSTFLVRFPQGGDDLGGAVGFELEQETDPQATPSKPRKRSLKGRVKSWLKKNSALYSAFMISVGPSVRALAQTQREIQQAERDRSERGWAIFESSLSRLQDLAREYGFELITVYIPAHSDLINGYDEVSHRFRDLMERRGLEYIDVYQDLQARDVLPYYFPVDGHFTVLGNDMLAARLAEVLATPPLRDRIWRSDDIAAGES